MKSSVFRRFDAVTRVSNWRLPRIMGYLVLALAFSTAAACSTSEVNSSESKSTDESGTRSGNDGATESTLSLVEIDGKWIY